MKTQIGVVIVLLILPLAATSQDLKPGYGRDHERAPHVQNVQKLAEIHEKDKFVRVFYFANDLLQMCAYKEIYPSEPLSEAADDLAKSRQCETYILAYAEVYSDSNGVRIPDGTPNEAIVESVRAWLKKHPALTAKDQKIPASIIMAIALNELYPYKAEAGE